MRVKHWSRCVGMLLVAAITLVPRPVRADDERLQLAMLQAGQATLFRIDEDGAKNQSPLSNEIRAPLGSLWKLFVHAYLVDRGLPDPGYQCTGQRREEIYCCEQRGETIDRDQALVRSCGLYYTPKRLGIDASEWRAYWQSRNAPAWLSDLVQVDPGTEVAVAELLQQLATLPAQAQIRAVLLGVIVDAGDTQLLGQLGAGLRVKTWSWHRSDDPTQRIGGFAGWLADGTPLWAMAPGTSRAVLARYAGAIEKTLPSRWPADAGTCVDVSLFTRYPIDAVQKNGKAVGPGALQGGHRVVFANGNMLDIESRGELLLTRTATGLRLTARISREEYVARVLDREAAPEPVQAARALAIAIRSYLQQNARRDGDCLRIDDSSAQQRVAPRPASAAARDIAAWTADLVLGGSPITYHLDSPGENRLSWTHASEAASNGARFDQILREAFPTAVFSRWGHPGNATCDPLDAARAWLTERIPGWRPRLDAEPGYSETNDFAVCRLASGRPHVDRAQRRVFIRALQTQQDRLDLVHEYLHLAFDAHPNGQDESYIEALARRLLLE